MLGDVDGVSVADALQYGVGNKAIDWLDTACVRAELDRRWEVSSDDVIAVVRSQRVDFYSCFISYSEKDHELAERLSADLQAKGVHCWFAPHHVQAGQKLHEQIDDAIRDYDRLLRILSAHSMHSEWVKSEIAKARKREVEERRNVLLPVRLVSFDELLKWECFDADTGKDSARELREYYIPDFTEWRDETSYGQACERLLRDLKKA